MDAIPRPLVKFHPLLLLLILLAFNAHGGAIRHRLPQITGDISTRLGSARKRQQPSTIAVTGPPARFGTQTRPEIRQLQQQADAWNLYLLGLQRFQQMNQSDPLSWYQVAGNCDFCDPYFNCGSLTG
jgi:tyrosinase